MNNNMIKAAATYRRVILAPPVCTHYVCGMDRRVHGRMTSL
jgi:hypothetical protein